MKVLLLCISLLLLTNGVEAKNIRYVTDELEITLRSGKSTKHQILRMIQSGTPVEVIEVDEESKYSKVKTPTGAIGWVISRYLENIPSARDRLAEAEKEIAKLKISNNRLNSDLGSVKQIKSKLSNDHKQLEKENRRLVQELTRIRQTAASAIAIDNENKDLKQKLKNLDREHQTLQQEAIALRDRTDRDWFMVGAGVVIIGIVIGLIIPNIRWRRKSSWDRL
ncbi:MAG: TIGR04211 family SH3 domain-containing protein [Gammaproteobacteria bacterium]